MQPDYGFIISGGPGSVKSKLANKVGLQMMELCFPKEQSRFDGLLLF